MRILPATPSIGAMRRAGHFGNTQMPNEAPKDLFQILMCDTSGRETRALVPEKLRPLLEAHIYIDEVAAASRQVHRVLDEQADLMLRASDAKSVNDLIIGWNKSLLEFTSAHEDLELKANKLFRAVVAMINS